MISYDLELSELFLEELKRIYQIENNFETYKYFICRFLCSEIIKFKDIKKKIPNIVNSIEYKKNIIDYTLNELDLITNSDHILYKDVPISIYGSGDNSIINTLIEMEATCLGLFSKDEFFKEIIFIVTKALNSSKRKCSNKKGCTYYNYYLIYYCLIFLNKHFNIKHIEEANINKISDIKFVQFAPSLKIEDRCSRYIDTAEDYRDSIKISEDTLEKYIYKNLDLIEDGLIPIKRQYSIRDGRLDILAKDKNGIYTIIELKIENDTNLVFQCIYYSNQLKLDKKVSNIRVITISPEYEYSLLDTLKHISNDYNIESYISMIKSRGMKGDKIDSLKLIKVI